MRIFTRLLIFHKEVGALNLANIVEIRRHPHQQAVSTDSVSSGLSQITYQNTVIISTGRLNHHLLQQRVIDVGQFHQTDAGGNGEHTFQQGQHTHHHNHRDNTVQQRHQRAHHQRLTLIIPHQAPRNRHQHIGNTDINGRQRVIRTGAHLAYLQNTHQAAHQRRKNIQHVRAAHNTHKNADDKRGKNSRAFVDQRRHQHGKSRHGDSQTQHPVGSQRGIKFNQRNDPCHQQDNNKQQRDHIDIADTQIIVAAHTGAIKLQQSVTNRHQHQQAQISPHAAALPLQANCLQGLHIGRRHLCTAFNQMLAGVYRHRDRLHIGNRRRHRVHSGHLVKNMGRLKFQQLFGLQHKICRLPAFGRCRNITFTLFDDLRQSLLTKLTQTISRTHGIFQAVTQIIFIHILYCQKIFQQRMVRRLSLVLTDNRRSQQLTKRRQLALLGIGRNPDFVQRVKQRIHLHLHTHHNFVVILINLLNLTGGHLLRLLGINLADIAG